MRVKQSEASIKNVCETWLNIQQLQGRLLWLRLNSGDIIIGEEGNKRRVKCCPKGTSDNLIILPARTRTTGKGTLCIFSEYKSSSGKMSPAQVSFEKQVTEQGHQYWLVYDAEEFIEEVGKLLK